jgi:hypothetical protein
MAAAFAARTHHEAHAPDAPERHDAVRYSSEWLMDDSVIVEADLGTRPWKSCEMLDRSIRLTWGDKAVNDDKKDEEGEPATVQLVWGLLLDFEAGTIALPEPKSMKMRYLLAEPELHPGNRVVRLRLVRELSGLAQFCATAQPAIARELPAVHRLLRTTDPRQTYVELDDLSEAEQDQVWEDFHGTVEWLRVLFEMPVSEAFTSAMASALSVREAMSHPECQVIWLGGDATMTRVGSLNWTERRVIHSSADVLLEGLREYAAYEGEEEIIAILELLAFLLSAAEGGPRWAGKLFLHLHHRQHQRGVVAQPQEGQEEPGGSPSPTSSGQS